MKKTVHIIVVIMLVLTTSGISISKHYCNGTLVSSVVNAKAKTCCETSCNACHTETVYTKITDDFVSTSYTLDKISELQKFDSPLWAAVLHPYCGISIIQKYSFLKAPPPFKCSESPEYLSVFRC